MIAGCVAALAVACVIFARYRKLKFTLPIILTSVSEVIIILGAAAVIKWTIDLSSIAGIIATVGTGVNAQIIILDEMRAGGAERVYTIKQKIKRAFFIIFGSASTVIAAMIPMLFIGIGVMRGFAITTIIGVLLAVFITRPAFSRIAEKLMERETPPA
jgi:preprotein translocase subunit SecD